MPRGTHPEPVPGQGQVPGKPIMAQYKAWPSLNIKVENTPPQFLSINKIYNIILQSASGRNGVVNGKFLSKNSPAAETGNPKFEGEGSPGT